MNGLQDLSIRIKGHKCFSNDEWIQLDGLKKINVVIGKNNAGKSALLDAIRQLSNESECLYDISFDKRKKESCFSYICNIVAGSYYSKILEFQKTVMVAKSIEETNKIISNKIIYHSCSMDGKIKINDIFLIDGHESLEKVLTGLGFFDFQSRLPKIFINPLLDFVFARLSAERNIVSESQSGSQMVSLSSNGVGATSLIERFLHLNTLKNNIVEDDLLSDLNKVFIGEAVFKRISCLTDPETSQWEIYLEEETKGKIPLSKSGSGLKTVIMVLIYLNVLPHYCKNIKSGFIYAFEELENNLHPSLYRKLLKCIFDKISKTKDILFLTTHSSIAIDFFSKNSEAQILHVTNDGIKSKIRKVKTYIDNQGVLDDLEVRASDILQSNGVIWVEGPSDRIYITKWIEVASKGQLQEGIHYQCVFYGGRLLSHLSADDPDEVEKVIPILTVNRNCIVVIDSDKQSEEANINETKQRIQSEILKNQGYCWITNCKEIENYIPNSVLKKWTPTLTSEESDVGQFDSFFEHLTNIGVKNGGGFSEKKPHLAELLIPHFTESDLTLFELNDELKVICTHIFRWNGMSKIL